jgi:hypothetical protein
MNDSKISPSSTKGDSADFNTSTAEIFAEKSTEMTDSMSSFGGTGPTHISSLMVPPEKLRENNEGSGDRDDKYTSWGHSDNREEKSSKSSTSSASEKLRENNEGSGDRDDKYTSWGHSDNRLGGEMSSNEESSSKSSTSSASEKLGENNEGSGDRDDKYTSWGHSDNRLGGEMSSNEEKSSKSSTSSASEKLQLEDLPGSSQKFNDSAIGMGVLQRLEERRKAQTASKPQKESQRSDSTDGPERKESTIIWTQADKTNEIDKDQNDTENDEVGWKPPALTTFSKKKHFPSAEKQQKKDPEAFDSSMKQAPTLAVDLIPPETIGILNSTIRGVKATSKSTKDIQPPLDEIIVTPTPDDDSTIGTEGTYLDRFPKGRKKKKKSQGGVSEAVKMRIEKATIPDRINVNKTVDCVTDAMGSTEMKPHITIGNEKTDKQQPLPEQRTDFVKLSSDGYNYQTILGSSNPSEKFEKSDPPGDAHLFHYNPNLNKWQPLSGLPESVDGDDAYDHASNQSSTSETMRHLPLNINSQSSIRTSWVPPGINCRREKVDVDPTRIFINSIMTRKRSTSPIQSKAEDRQLQLKPEIRTQSRRQSTSARIDFTGTVDWTGSSYSLSQSRAISIVDRSEPSNGSDQYRNTNQLQAAPNISSYSKGSDDSYHIEHETVGIRTKVSEHNAISPSNPDGEQSLSQLDKPRDMQFQMDEQESNGLGKCASSSSSSSLPEQLSKEVKQPVCGRRGRTTIVLVFIAAILILGSAIVIVVLWQLGVLFDKKSDDTQSAPINAPPIVDTPTSTPLRDISVSPSSLRTPTFAQPESDINLFNLITEAYPQGRLALQDPSSPQGKALKWLESSANNGVYTEQRFLQRYVLSTVYYSTNGNDWINNTAWLSDLDECSWMSTAQFVCDDSGRYIELGLQENNLVGTLPQELVILSDSLRVINLRKNKLFGELPAPMISDIANLEVLDLSSNVFSGTLSPQLFDAIKLTRLSLFENSLSSFIPTELGMLRELNVLDLGSNRLTSSIPSTIDKLSKLVGLSVFDNMLTGTVPSMLANLQSLEMLYIDSNNFEGPLSTGICLLNLENFWSDCEAIQCTCCTKCCSNDFGCFAV